MNRYLCIHGHFYQPPRENPWLEEVELQDSAYPYHDWNQRITQECYAPNTTSRILDPDRRIIDIINNYTKISFNFGPTLLSWLEKHNPEVYKVIIESDKISQKHFSGHGSALAQCYNHIIMPLASTKDKETQILWGIKDFLHRFGRSPEGMWLPETAVDLQTLDLMSGQGIKFAILAPNQAKRVRKISDNKWDEVSGSKIDPKMVYQCVLPSKKTIALFFYDGPISHDVSFGDILSNGENFAKRLVSVFSKDENPQLVHIATDGETYGHHHGFGDMALAFGLYYIEKNNLAKITIYGEYLEKNPPTHEVEIHENSSWSCGHGVERWRNDCGCKVDPNRGWSQAWRAPLREAMDWLRDGLIPIYERQMSGLVRDPWKARDEYIEVILDRSVENVERFLKAHAVKELSKEEEIKILKLLEMQRHAMLMFTSCGWFFDEISGIETVQVLLYAARAIQLAREVSGIVLENEYVKLLEKAPSNIPEYENGARLYKDAIMPAILDIARVGAHYAVSSLFEEYPQELEIYSYTANSKMYDRTEVGKQKLAVGKAHIRSNITRNENIVSFAVLHFGDHNIAGGVRYNFEGDGFSRMHQELKEVFSRNDIGQTINLIQNNFDEHNYSLWHLFKDEQRKVLNQILDVTIKEVEVSLRQFNEHHYPVIQVIRDIHVPLPKVLAITIGLMLNTDLVNTLENEEVDFSRLKGLVEEARKWTVDLDRTTLSFLASNKVNNTMERLGQTPQENALLNSVDSILSTLNPLSLNLNLWKAQNIYFSIAKKLYTQVKSRADTGDDSSRRWIELFNNIGRFLKVKIV